MSQGSTHDTQPPPEGILIRRRREGMGISPERLSQLLRENGDKVSGRRIREIEEGRARHGQPTSARANTLAAVALALGIIADDLVEAGREDAAEVARQRVKEQAEREPAIAALIQEAGGSTSEADTAAVMQVVFQGLNDIRNARGLTDAQKRRIEHSYLQSLRRNVESNREQLNDTLRVLGEDSA